MSRQAHIDRRGERFLPSAAILSGKETVEAAIETGDRLQGFELRSSPRFDAHFRCWCEGPLVTFFTRAANFSEGGIFLRTSTPLSCGEVARVRFSVVRI